MYKSLINELTPRMEIEQALESDDFFVLQDQVRVRMEMLNQEVGKLYTETLQAEIDKLQKPMGSLLTDD